MSNLNKIRKSWELGDEMPQTGWDLWLLLITSLININSFPDIQLTLSFTIAQLTLFNCTVFIVQLQNSSYCLLWLENLHHTYCFCKCHTILSPTLMPQHLHQFHFGTSLTTSTLNQVWVSNSCRSMTSMHFF
jgi:hypothetical protein